MQDNADHQRDAARTMTDDLARDGEILFRIFEYAPDAIILVDASGRIMKANMQAEAMFGHARSDLIGSPVEILIPDRYSPHHLGYRDGYLAAPHARPMGVGLNLFGKRRDGTEFPVDIMLSPVATEPSTVVLAVVRDATERRRIEKLSNDAREMYIKEIHHRVKNNLQVISSLLFLQSAHTTDATTLDILEESRSRVKSIALIHEKLYRSTEISRLDFAEYIRDLVSDLFRSYGARAQNITVHTEITNVLLDVDTAIPCGLIINELITNVMKHAFPPGTPGEVVVEMAPIGDKEFRLLVSDNGIGLPKGFDPRRSSSLGLKLVSDLTRQLEGKLEITSDNGTAFHITFRELHYKERS